MVILFIMSLKTEPRRFSPGAGRTGTAEVSLSRLFYDEFCREECYCICCCTQSKDGESKTLLLLSSISSVCF
jgi:hypothetical protein